MSATAFQRRRRELAKAQAEKEVRNEKKVPMEHLSVEEIKEKYTVPEIKARLDELGVEYSSDANEDELAELLSVPLL